MNQHDDRWFLLAGVTLLLVPFVYMFLVTAKVA